MNMDPALMELVDTGSPEDEVSVILRLAPGADPPPTVRVVSRFDEIVTARVRRDAIVATRQSEGVVSLKATSVVTEPPLLEDVEFGDAIDEASTGPSMPPAALYRGPETGRGVVVGICDWGLDFTHANFRNADGTTRLQALWDQRGENDPLAPAPYNYGRLLTRSAINAALNDLDPFASLDYNPCSADADQHWRARHTRVRHRGRQSPGTRLGGWPRHRIGHRVRAPGRTATRRGRQPGGLGGHARRPRFHSPAGGRTSVCAALERRQDRRTALWRYAARARGGRDAEAVRHRPGAERGQLRAHRDARARPRRPRSAPRPRLAHAA